MHSCSAYPRVIPCLLNFRKATWSRFSNASGERAPFFQASEQVPGGEPATAVHRGTHPSRPAPGLASHAPLGQGTRSDDLGDAVDGKEMGPRSCVGSPVSRGWAGGGAWRGAEDEWERGGGAACRALSEAWRTMLQAQGDSPSQMLFYNTTLPTSSGGELTSHCALESGRIL